MGSPGVTGVLPDLRTKHPEKSRRRGATGQMSPRRNETEPIRLYDRFGLMQNCTEKAFYRTIGGSGKTEPEIQRKPSKQKNEAINSRKNKKVV